MGLFETFGKLVCVCSGNTKKLGGSELTKKEQDFCLFVAKGNNAEEACRLAGYKRNNWGNVLMQREDIALEIQKLLSSSCDDVESGLNKEILEFLTDAMRGNCNDEIDIRTRMRAAELLTKRGKLFEKDGDKEKSTKILIVDDIP